VFDAPATLFVSSPSPARAASPAPALSRLHLAHLASQRRRQGPTTTTTTTPVPLAPTPIAYHPDRAPPPVNPPAALFLFYTASSRPCCCALRLFAAPVSALTSHGLSLPGSHEQHTTFTHGAPPPSTASHPLHPPNTASSRDACVLEQPFQSRRCS
jgi:hypothetical protein